MARGSKKGACSANTKKAKRNALEHDRRNEETEKVPQYVNRNRSHLNSVIFEDDMVKGRKHLQPLIERAEKLYTEKTHQKCQKSFAPFKESVLRINDSVTNEQLMNFVREEEKLLGWKCVGLYRHEDEGYAHSKYIEGDENFAINHHAHVLWYAQDPVTGKAIRIKGKKILSQMQDDLAKFTGMKRGNKAADTGIKHRSAMQYRIDMQEERIEKLQSVIDELENNIDALNVSKAVKERLMSIVGKSKADKDLEQQKSKNEQQKKNYEAKLNAQAKRYESQIEELRHEINTLNFGKALDAAAVKAQTVQDIARAAHLNINSYDAEKVGKAIENIYDENESNKQQVKQLKDELDKANIVISDFTKKNENKQEQGQQRGISY